MQVVCKGCQNYDEEHRDCGSYITGFSRSWEDATRSVRLSACCSNRLLSIATLTILATTVAQRKLKLKKKTKKRHTSRWNRRMLQVVSSTIRGTRDVSLSLPCENGFSHHKLVVSSSGTPPRDHILLYELKTHFSCTRKHRRELRRIRKVVEHLV